MAVGDCGGGGGGSRAWSVAPRRPSAGVPQAYLICFSHSRSRSPWGKTLGHAATGQRALGFPGSMSWRPLWVCVPQFGIAVWLPLFLGFGSVLELPASF